MPPKSKQYNTTVHTKYQALYENQTHGISFNLTTDDIVNQRVLWGKQHSISIPDVSHNGLTVSFCTLPDNLDQLTDEIYQFCPDIIDQAYSGMDAMHDMAEETDQPITPEVFELIEGIDFSKDDCGFEILKRDLEQNKRLSLWWD